MQRLRITVLSLLAAAVPALSPAVARASSPCADGFDPFVLAWFQGH